MTREEAFEFLGIQKFRELGYTGSRIKIMSDEKILKEYRGVDKDRWTKVICPKGHQRASGSWHGSSIMQILQDICPDATFIAMPMDMKGSGDNYSSKCIDYILENKVHLFTTSCVGGTCSEAKEKAMQDCIDAGTTFFCASGNEGNKGMLEESKTDKHIAIGALEPNMKLKKANYSSIGEELDYVSIGFYGIGTSFTTPTFCAMCGLAQDFFIHKTGRALYRHELIDFINDNLLDVEDKGFDIKTGHGLFILPNPLEIDIGKYVPEYKECESVLKQKLIDQSKYSIKCPYEMDAEFIVVHNTANDASAINEVNYMANNSNKVSFHIAVDDKEAIQAIPFDRNAFHAGDGTNGKGNRKGIGIEICYSKSGGEKFEKAKENAIEVIVDILKERNWDITKVRKHQDFSGKYCPHRILDEGWDKFIAQIQERIGGANMKELVLTIGQKEYSVDNQIKRIEVAPRIENGRTLVPIAVLRDLGLDVEWNAEKRTVTVRG